MTSFLMVNGITNVYKGNLGSGGAE